MIELQYDAKEIYILGAAAKIIKLAMVRKYYLYDWLI